MDYQSIDEIEKNSSSWSFNYSNFLEYYTKDPTSIPYSIMFLALIVLIILSINHTIRNRSFLFTGAFLTLFIFVMLAFIMPIPNDVIKVSKIQASVEHNISEKYNLSDFKSLRRLSTSLEKENLTYEMLYNKNEENKTIPIVIKINKETGEPKILIDEIMTPEYVKGLERINK